MLRIRTITFKRQHSLKSEETAVCTKKDPSCLLRMPQVRFTIPVVIWYRTRFTTFDCMVASQGSANTDQHSGEWSFFGGDDDLNQLFESEDTEAIIMPEDDRGIQT